MAPSSDGGANNAEGAHARTTASHVTKSTAYFISEGLHGCFKDKVLCGVQYEPCALRIIDRRRVGTALSHCNALKDADGEEVQDEAVVAQRGQGQHQMLVKESCLGSEPVPTLEAWRDQQEVDEPDELEDAVVMGPSGQSEDVVSRKRLPRSLGPGDWLYFSRMGAYTTSIASVMSSSAIYSPFFYVASTPATRAFIDAVDGHCQGLERDLGS